jgi:hypothetical protein
LYFYIASLLKQQSTGIRCVTEGSSPLKRWEMKTTSSVASNWNVSERAFFVKLKIHSDISFIWIIWVLLVCHKWGLGFWCLMQFQFSVSVILWQPVLLVEETGVPGENHWPVASHWQNLSHNVVSSTPRLSGVSQKNWHGAFCDCLYQKRNLKAFGRMSQLFFYFSIYMYLV